MQFWTLAKSHAIGESLGVPSESLQGIFGGFNSGSEIWLPNGTRNIHNSLPHSFTYWKIQNIMGIYRLSYSQLISTYWKFSLTITYDETYNEFIYFAFPTLLQETHLVSKFNMCPTPNSEGRGKRVLSALNVKPYTFAMSHSSISFIPDLIWSCASGVGQVLFFIWLNVHAVHRH